MPSGGGGRRRGTRARLGSTSLRPAWRRAGAETRWASGGVRHDSIGAVDHDRDLRRRHPLVPSMTDAERTRQVAIADMVAAVEPAAADLAIAEEPSGFAGVLAAGAPAPDPGHTPPPSSRG